VAAAPYAGTRVRPNIGHFAAVVAATATLIAGSGKIIACPPTSRPLLVQRAKMVIEIALDRMK
jgi:hypothetical protein